MTTPDRFIAGAVDLSSLAAPAPQQESAAYCEITRENLETEVVRRSAQVPVVVQVGSVRSGESEQLKADLKNLAQAAGGRFGFAYVDADATPDLAQALGARAVPTVVAVAAGQPVANFEGSQPKDALAQWIQALITQLGPQLSGPPAAEEPADPRLVAAAEALDRGEYDAAISAYEDILTAEPRNGAAKQARDTARLMQRISQRGAADPIAAAGAEPQDVVKAFAAADAEIIAGQAESAFGRLIALLPNKEVQARLVELFEIFDPADPRVLAARSAMANALF